MKKSTEATVIDGDWVTLAEAVQILGKSQSTVERLVGSGALKSKLDPREGRKPERLYNADDVRRLARGDEPNSRSLSVVRPPAETRLAIPQDTISAFRDVMTEWRNAPQMIPIPSKLWLDFDEAQAYSGLSRGFLLGLIDTEKIMAVKGGPHGSWRIRRESLEAFEG